MQIIKKYLKNDNLQVQIFFFGGFTKPTALLRFPRLLTFVRQICHARGFYSDNRVAKKMQQNIN